MLPQNKKITRPRQRRSEKLSANERKAFKRYANSFDTIQDCADALELNRDTVSDILKKGSGHPTSIWKIRTKLAA